MNNLACCLALSFILEGTAKTITINNPSIFSIQGFRHEVFVVKKTYPQKCFDNSTASVQNLQTNTKTFKEKYLETRVQKCSTKTPSILQRPWYSATVCHAFSGHRKNMPTKSTVQQWVKYYLDRGFQHVYWYIYEEKHALNEIDGVTWFVAPWLKNTQLHWGGQLFAMHHCLLWNKQEKTEWTLYADVDEFLAVTRLYQQPKINLVETALRLSPVSDKKKIAAFDFGEYRIWDFMKKLSENKNISLMERITFDMNKLDRGITHGYAGHRKNLVRNQFISKLAVHACQKINNSLITYHFHPWVMSLIHLRNLISFRKIE